MRALCHSIGSILIAAIASSFTPEASAAELLVPGEFSSLGILSPNNNITVNTETLILQEIGGDAYQGVIQAQGPGSPEIAVFSFDLVSIPAGATVSVIGSRPLAILSRDSLFLAGTIDIAGRQGGNRSGDICRYAAGGISIAGGGRGGTGGFACGGSTSGERGQGLGGGDGGVRENPFGAPGKGGSFGGTVGAPSYGNLLLALEAGSGGGGGSAGNSTGDGGAGGGSGGGGIELGAANELIVTGEIIAFGGNGGDGFHDGGSGGGGSGGGVILHGGFVEISPVASIDASSGAGSWGAGGRILVVSSDDTIRILDLSVFDVTSQDLPRGLGVVESVPVPESEISALMLSGAVGLWSISRRRKAGIPNA